MAAFIAFMAAEVGAIVSHQDTLDKLTLDLNELKKCSRVLAQEAETEDPECKDAQAQYDSVKTQRDAYDSVSTGLWIKFIALIAMEVALIASVVVEVTGEAARRGGSS